jgi:hypothetical protein
MRIVVISALALALGVTFAAAAPWRHPAPRHAALRHAAPPQQKPHPFDVAPGTEVTIPISVAPLGASPPKDGEITVGLDRIKGEFYNQITVSEKTAQPINFLVTALNGGTKIDETEICGRLDAPITARVGSTAWRFWVNGFEIGKGGADCG